MPKTSTTLRSERAPKDRGSLRSTSKPKSPARKIRIGFIGCGGIAGRHFNQLLECREAEVVALSDVAADEGCTRFFDRAPKARALPMYSDWRRMLDDVELDAVEIASPHTAHFEQVMEALGRGLHVLVEKPMVCSVEDAKKVIARAKRKQRVVVVSYQRHYAGGFRYVRDAIAKGVLGKVHFVSAMQAQHWYPGTGWRGIPELSGGGQLNDSGSHLIDMLLWTTGFSPKEVFAYIDNMGAKVDILSAISVKFKGGALANISIVGHSPGWWEDFSVWGDKAAIYLRDERILLQKDRQAVVDVTDQAKDAGNPDRNFIDAILGRAEVQSGPSTFLPVIQLTQAAWDSARQGCPVVVAK